MEPDSERSAGHRRAGARALRPNSAPHRARSFGRRLSGFFLLLVLQAGDLQIADASPRFDWEPVADGVDYRAYALPGPVQVHVARLEIGEPKVFLESAIAAGGLSGGLETVSGMARRYDGYLTSWGGAWGGRGKVLVAINGSSYNPATSEPYGGQFHAGWYSLRYGDLAGGSGFVWTRGRRAAIRGCVDHGGEQQRVIRLKDRSAFEIDALNLRRPDDGLLLFTPQFGPITPEGKGETEVVVRVDGPVAALPSPRGTEGVVIEVREGSGSTPILFDQVVLAAKGPAAVGYARGFSPGDRLTVSQAVTDLGFGCRQQASFPWDDVFSGIGGGFVFLRDEEVFHSDERGAAIRDPRTAVCLNQDHVYFVVVDGRQPGLSIGMSLDQVADFCREELAADWGLNQDGGGSSSMWVGGRIVNSPSDGSERSVANGLLMMGYEPEAHSSRFAPGYRVEVQIPGPLRAGPGDTQPIREAAGPDLAATVLQAATGLQGVFVQGSFWWKVEVAGETGWIAEQTLVTPGQALAVFSLPPPPRASAP